MNRQRAWNKLIWVPVLALLFGCAPRHLRSNSEFGTRLQNPSEIEELWQRIGQANNQIKSFRTLATLTSSQGEQADRMREIIVFERPEHLRLELIPLREVFTLSLLAVNGAQAVLVDTTRKEASKFSNGAEALARWLKVRLEADDLMAYLVGRVPVGSGTLNRATCQWFRSTISAQLRLDCPGGTWTFDESSLNLRALELRETFRGQAVFGARYESFKEHLGISIPTQVFLTLKRHDLELALEYQKITVNENFSDTLFSAVIPADYSQHSQRNN